MVIGVTTAEELSIENLFSAVGVQRNMVEQSLDVLACLSLLQRLGAWASGAAGREVKRHKVQLIDTVVAAAIWGFASTSFGPTGDQTALGHLLETFVGPPLAALGLAQPGRPGSGSTGRVRAVYGGHGGEGAVDIERG